MMQLHLIIKKKTTIEGKGVLNNRISEHILSNLSQIGIKNHLVKRLNMREQIINCLLYTSPSPRDVEESRMPSSA